MAGESAPPPIHPVLAAQKLRIISRGIHNRASNMLSLIHVDTKSVNLYYNESAINAASVDEHIRLAREAATARKGALANEHLDSLVRHLQRERRNYREAYGLLVAPSENQQVLRNEINLLVDSCKQVMDLVQSLPTTEDMPSGNMENMLRAIMAILRTGGFPGAQDLKWEEVKKNGEKAQSNGTTAPQEGAASPEGTGAAVFEPVKF